MAGASVPHSLWQTAQTGEAMQVWQANDAPCCTGTGLAQKNGRERLATQVRMNALVRLTHETALAMLTAPSVDTPPVIPAMMLYHMTPSGAPVLPQNLWQRWLSHHTALGSLPGWQPDTSSADVLLPDFILPLLPLGVSETPRADFTPGVLSVHPCHSHRTVRQRVEQPPATAAGGVRYSAL